MVGPPRASRLASFALTALLAAVDGGAAAPPMTEWKTTLAGEALAGCTRDRFTDYCADAGGLCLAPTWLIADAMARSSKIRESLTPDVEAKKLFDLPAAVESAEVLFHGGGGTEEEPLLISVNGHEIRHVQDRERMLTGGWDRETIPGRWLRPGRNELVFSGAGLARHRRRRARRQQLQAALRQRRVEGGHARGGQRPHGRVRRPPESPRPSAGGRGHLPHPRPGRGASGGSRAGGDGPAPVRRSRAAARNLRPLRGALRLDGLVCRRPVDLLARRRPGRDPARGAVRAVAGPPLKRRSRPHSRSEERDHRGLRAAPPGRITVEIEVVEAPDNALAVSSYAFDYADPHHPRMRHLREKYRLEEVVAPGQTEMERFDLLRQWVRRQWEGWNENEYNYCPQWDALEILELAPRNLALGMCTHYAAVFTQCAGALGYHARALIVDHHCLAEIWSDEHGKWILQDPGLLPGQEVAFQYEAAGVPINALEMHRIAAAGDLADIDFVPPPPVPAEQLQGLFAQLYQRFGIPLRNDHLYRSEPQELEQGMDQYHWDGHLWWTDSLDPRYPEYSLQTNRPEDFYWDLNRTRIDLQDTETAAALAVRLSGPIPHLDRFEVSLDRGEWEESGPSFEWKLSLGRNRLRARAVNTMGLRGPENRVELEYRPG